jgi:hypothetical protein
MSKWYGRKTMGKVFSVRIDTAIYQKIHELAYKMQTTKKAIVEQAIRLLGQRYDQEKETNPFDETSGIWEREETPEETVKKARNVFWESMKRKR